MSQLRSTAVVSDVLRSFLRYRRRQFRWLVTAIVACITVILVGTLVPATAQKGIYGEIQTEGYREVQSEVQADIQDGSGIHWLAAGKQAYDAGQFSHAVRIWQQGIEQGDFTAAFEQLSEVEQRAIAHNYLAIGYQSLGNWPAATQAVAQSLSLLSGDPASFLIAQALSTQSEIQLHLGQTEIALASLAQAERIYRQYEAPQQLIRNQILQAQAMRTLGYYRRSQQQLEHSLQMLSDMPNSWLKAKAMQSLGTTLRITGDLEQSQSILLAALNTIDTLAPNILTAEALANNIAIQRSPIRLSLAKTLAAQEEPEQALTLAQTVIEQSSRVQPQIEAALLQLDLLQHQGEREQAQQLFSRLATQLKTQPASRWVVSAQVNLATLASAPMPERATTNSEVQRYVAPAPELANLLSRAVRVARTLDDSRAQSYSLGALGHVYEQAQQWEEAQALTEQALAQAQAGQADEIITQWQWQKGRILASQGDFEGAIALYTEAVDGLEGLQQDLVVMNSEVQFSFREQIEPVYRQLVGLLLKELDRYPTEKKQIRLIKAREVIESLQLAELQNYFREACLTYQTRSIEFIDEQAAVIYPILLTDRIEMIASLPNQPLQHYGFDFPVSEQEALLRNYYFSLNPISDAEYALPYAQQLYDYLVRPIRPALKQQSIKTLVFVPDGFLRSLPMAALHDGEQYLIENYRVALTPGMQLLNSQSLNVISWDTFTAGISESRQGFSALPAVREEITEINALTQARSLLNETFTKDNFFSGIHSTDANVIHVATHGKFSSSANNTYLLAWDERINVRELDTLIRQSGRDRPPIELLVLSACQTASGDRRAALGIAGIAVRSGARSTIATLWSVADQSTAEIMTRFYQRLLTPRETEASAEFQISRAEALRQAQLSLLHSEKYSHPYYWSPFVLVGSWQ